MTKDELRDMILQGEQQQPSYPTDLNALMAKIKHEITRQQNGCLPTPIAVASDYSAFYELVLNKLLFSLKYKVVYDVNPKTYRSDSGKINVVKIQEY